ncbi:DUF1682-domain-containing protein [Thozetella sp. PMI_491]|nr:DUF1682-domain-containing protein [Thozetella sp. PMI_491]
MASVLNNLFGGPKSAETPVPSADSDFADFAEAPEPAPEYTFNPTGTLGGAGPDPTARPYTKWYNIHERHSISDFKAEGIIMAGIAFVLVLHLFGARLNRNKAKKWIRAHATTLSTEFALVGFDGVPAAAADKSGGDLVEALADANVSKGDRLLKEKSLFEFATYATGRANVAFLDVKLTLMKRFNPFQTIAETGLGFFFDSMGTPEDTMEAIMYPFDGKESQLVPGLPGAAELRARDAKSAYDSFVWAIVNKDRMKQVREDRYDVSLTFTKDNNKLPVWLTVMTESAEITDAMLTPELIAAVEAAGDRLDYLIITDQPTEKPRTISETTPRKRLFLKYRLPSNNDYQPLLPLFQCFTRLPDVLVQSAHFRPAVVSKVKTVREDAIKQIQKVDEDEKAEERALEKEKARKIKRDQELNALDAKAQKRYLEKEREKEMRKSMKRQTQRA